MGSQVPGLLLSPTLSLHGPGISGIMRTLDAGREFPVSSMDFLLLVKLPLLLTAPAVHCPLSSQSTLKGVSGALVRLPGCCQHKRISLSTSSFGEGGRESGGGMHWGRTFLGKGKKATQASLGTGAWSQPGAEHFVGLGPSPPSSLSSELRGRQNPLPPLLELATWFEFRLTFYFFQY